jgi:predicted metalloendopeptidase
VPVSNYLEGSDSNFLSAYKTFLQELFQAFGANEATATEYSKGIVNLEIDLVKVRSYVIIK